MSELKQVLVIRRDLWLRTGSQVRLATQAAVRVILEESQMELVSEWLETGAKMEVYTVNSKIDLERIYTAARDTGNQPVWLAKSDHNKVDGPVPAALAIGPGSAEQIDPIIAGLSKY